MILASGSVSVSDSLACALLSSMRAMSSRSFRSTCRLVATGFPVRPRPPSKRLEAVGAARIIPGVSGVPSQRRSVEEAVRGLRAARVVILPSMLEDMRRYVRAGIQALSSEAPDQLASSLMAKAQDVAEQLTALAAGFRQWSAE